MSKVTLEFNLDDPDDASHYNQVVRARALSVAIWEFDQVLRLSVRYSEEGTPDNVIDTYEKVRSLLWEKLEEYNVNVGD